MNILSIKEAITKYSRNNLNFIMIFGMVLDNHDALKMSQPHLDMLADIVTLAF
jgi:hypothetical protein